MVRETNTRPRNFPDQSIPILLETIVPQGCQIIVKVGLCPRDHGAQGDLDHIQNFWGDPTLQGDKPGRMMRGSYICRNV